MRSLTPARLKIACVADIVPDGRISAGAIDPETGDVYIVLESEAEGIQLEICRIPGEGSSASPLSASEPIASFFTPVRAPFELPTYRSEVLDLHYFADNRSLALILSGGDIATLSLDGSEGSSSVDVVGSVDSGIKAAAWSPDEEHLILVTGEDNLVCMTRLFDLVHEEPLRSEEFGEDDFINVGWGSKQTQFHGSLGKAAARIPTVSTSAGPSSLRHPTDDSLPVISFRGDAAFFAISSLDPYTGSELSRRQIRIYSCPSGGEPKLSATSESLPGLEGPLAWRPSGNLISTLVRYGYEGGGPGNSGRWDVAMLERNGLRHGGFELREDRKTWQDGIVKGMSWNIDSEVLAVWIGREDHDVVQLWSMKNYHYYLKQEVLSYSRSRRFNGFQWHPEEALTLYLYTEDCLQTRQFVWDTYASHISAPDDTASVAVVDGNRLLVTPFRTQNIPPPMSAFRVSLPSTPVHVSMSNFEDSLAILYSDGLVQYWDLGICVPEPKTGFRIKGGRAAEPRLRWQSATTAGVDESHPELSLAIPTQIAVGNDHISVLSKYPDGDAVYAFDSQDGERSNTLRLKEKVERILTRATEGCLLLHSNGDVCSLAHTWLCATSPDSITFSVINDILVALSANGKLTFRSLTSGPSELQLLASGVTSFTYTADYLIYTTNSQRSFFAPIPTLQRMLADEEVEEWEIDWEERAIERGALAVTACESSMSLVLQMPRGNLETVYPRPLVLAVVRKDVAALAYRAAFVQIRKHRLDLNLLYDLDPQKFLANLSVLVDQVPEVDYLNLLTSSLRDGTLSRDIFPDLRRSPLKVSGGSEKVNTVCDSLRVILEKRDFVKYTETILTTYVCKRPADYEGALNVLLRLQKDNSNVAEDAVKYIIFLSNVNMLYDVALGMYDFNLVLMVAQYSQKDPKEYLPFLRELRALEDWERKFRIDDYLERHSSALRHLHSAGPAKFDSSLEYIGKYELYAEAFRLYRSDTEHLTKLRKLYGDYLFDRREYAQAALAYRLAGRLDQALKAYERAHAWREVLSLAISNNLPQTEVTGYIERCSDYLSTRGRHLEASRLLLDYANDVDGAVSVLAAGSEFSEAFRIAHLKGRTGLIEKSIYPAFEDAHEAIIEVFEEMDGQLDKELVRLRALNEIRHEDPESFFMVDTEPVLEGVDVATNATTAASVFTRYTAAPTTTMSQSTKRTGRTDKTRNKASKKRAAGRKGTVDEYEYLVASIGRLGTRLDEKSTEATNVLRHLILATETYQGLATGLQRRIDSFRRKYENSVEEAWKDRWEIILAAEQSGGMGYNEGQEIAKAREMVKPKLGKWDGLGYLAIED